MVSRPDLYLRAPHPLWGAEMRAKRARTHIRSLERQLKRYAVLHRDAVVWQVDAAGEVVGGRLKGDVDAFELLGRAGIWIGEVVYNLRSALDYLVYSMACVGNGQRHVSNTQFPICDDWDDFVAQATGMHPRTGKNVTCRLDHVPADAVARIGQLQPSSSPPCQWTAQLRDLSNLDKHRAMTSLRSEANLIRGNHPDLHHAVPVAERSSEEYYFVVGIFFKDTRDDVVDTLKLLQGNVRSLIEEFKPSFKRLP